MIPWLIIGTIAALALVALARPLFAAPKERFSPDETDYLAAQIDDVERERAIGILSEAEAETARLEAKRRLLAAGRARKEGAPGGDVGAMLRQAAVMGVGAIPLAAIALYLAIGSPDQKSPERAASAPTQDVTARPVADLVASLEEKLAANPEDIEGWVTLAESYASFGGFADAAKAFEKAAALDPSSAFLEAAVAESLILANAGAITEAAEASLARALTLDPKEPRALYYSAQGEYQNGDKDEALKMMAALVNDAAEDASWLPLAQNELVSMAMAMGRTLDEAGVSQEAQERLQQTMQQDVAAAKKPAPAGDVASLEAKVASDDAHYTEWLQLAELHAAAGETEKAVEVIARARERYAAAPFVLQEIARTEERIKGEDAAPRRGPTADQIEAAQSMTPEDQQAMIQGMVSGLAARLEAEPNDPEGWMMLGRSYGVLGDLGRSAEAFSRAAALKPDDNAVQLSYAQALLVIAEAANAPIDSKTEKVLEGVLKRDADQTFALYYLGLAAQQRQDKSTARRHWGKLASLLPAASDDAKRIGELLRSLD